MENRPSTVRQRWRRRLAVAGLCLVNPVVFVVACSASLGLSGEEYSAVGDTSTAVYEKWSYQFAEPATGDVVVGRVEVVQFGEAYTVEAQGVITGESDGLLRIDGWRAADSVPISYTGPMDRSDVDGRVVGRIESPDSLGDVVAIALLLGIPALFLGVWVTFYALAEWTRSQSRAPTGWWWLTFLTWGPGLVLYRRRVSGEDSG